MKQWGLVVLAAAACGGHHDPEASVDAATSTPPDVAADAATTVIGRACDPINDNDFDGAGPLTKTGTACGNDPTIGCFPTGANHVTAFTCQKSDNPDARNGASVPDGQTCAPGYIPGFNGCAAMCVPGEAYNAASPERPNGVAGHACNTTDAAGTFGAIPDGTASGNGVHCQYWWMNEIDDNNAWHPSAYSNTLGTCFDHTQYLASKGGNGSTLQPLPACAGLPVFGTSSTYGAADLGCVDSTLAGLH